ncbi:hypothetical protein HOA92_00790 [archaeon]|nr:hypothetical protein [archaeon]MBT6761554.1 hypothetical protein [archaeon]
MVNIKHLFLEFIGCHGGKVNRFLHVLGLALILTSIFQKNIYLLIIGAIFQEMGHFYQYYKTKNKSESPLQCLKPQLLFAYPLLIIIIIYILI